MSLSWDETLALGIAEIDGQHKDIFARFDKLSLACQEQHGEDVVSDLLVFLDEYAACHFADEEALMERYNYPGLLIQREQHAAFRQDIMEMHSLAHGSMDSHQLSLMIDRRLVQWFILHVRNLDRELVAFLNQ